MANSANGGVRVRKGEENSPGGREREQGDTLEEVAGRPRMLTLCSV